MQDPVGELCHGRRLYGALHASLRVLGAITAVRPRVGVTCVTFNKEAREVELKWTMAANAPFVGQSALKVNIHGSVLYTRYQPVSRFLRYATGALCKFAMYDTGVVYNNLTETVNKDRSP